MTVKTLFDKIVKRAKRKIDSEWTQRVPFNSQYKPVGIKPLIRQSTEDIEYFQFQPPYISTIELTKEFIDDCSQYVKPVMSLQTPGDFVITLKQGRIYCSDFSNIAVITKDNYVMDDVSFQWGHGFDEIIATKYNAIFELKGFIKPKIYKGRVFSLLSGGGAKHYYYHWVYETMPKLFLLIQSGEFDKVDYFFVPRQTLKFQREYLRHFGITDDKIIDEEEVHHIKADLLMVTSHVKYKDHHSKWVCDFLYNSFIKKSTVKPPQRRIYISRGDAARNRRVHNEHKLIEMLKELGFECLQLTSLTVNEQAALFNSASMVVGSHGGGLSNFTYCQPGTIVLEMFPDKYVRHMFYDIANKSGLQYHYMLLPSDTADAVSSVDGQLIGLIADVPLIRNKVKSLIASQGKK